MDLLQVFREMIEVVEAENIRGSSTSFCPPACAIKTPCNSCPMNNAESRAKALEMLDALERQDKMIKLIKD